MIDKANIPWTALPFWEVEARAASESWVNALHSDAFSLEERERLRQGCCICLLKNTTTKTDSQCVVCQEEALKLNHA